MQLTNLVVYLIRQPPEGTQRDARIDNLPLYITRIYQDCPISAFGIRKVKLISINRDTFVMSFIGNYAILALHGCSAIPASPCSVLGQTPIGSDSNELLCSARKVTLFLHVEKICLTSLKIGTIHVYDGANKPASE